MALAVFYLKPHFRIGTTFIQGWKTALETEDGLSSKGIVATDLEDWDMILSTLLIIRAFVLEGRALIE